MAQEWPGRVVGGAPAPAPAPQPRPTIGGTRVLGGVPPSEQRAQQDQILQTRADARAEEANARAAEAAQREAERLRLSQQSEARQQQEAQLGTESERTAGFLAGRVKDSTLRLVEAAKKNPEAQNPTLGVEAVRGIFGDTAANYLSDAERQQIRAAQLDIIDAGLTLGTGAAYTKEQLEAYREIYFPKLGDSEATIASKREALRSLLVNAQTKAGRAAPDIEAALAALDGLSQGGGTEQNPDRPREVVYGSLNPDVPTHGGLDASNMSDGAYKNDPVRGEPGFFDVATQGATLGLSDEAAGVGTVIGQALLGNFDVAGNYVKGRDEERARIEQARNNMGPIASTATELISGGGAIRNAPNALMGLGRGIAATGQPVTRAALQQGLVRQGTQGGAAIGAAGGFGYGEGTEGSVGNALLGGAVGGVLGNVGARYGNAVVNRPPTGPSGGAQAQAAADELGIELTPAVTGGAMTRRLTAGAQQGFLSQAPIQNAVTRMETQGGAARDRIASQAGRVLDAEDAGDVVREAANVYSRRTSQIGGNLYRRADARAGGVKLPLPKAVQAVDEEMAQIAKAPGGAESAFYKDLAAMKRQMEGGAFEVDGIRAFRSKIRTEMTERGLRGTPQDTAYQKVLQAAEDDMISGLQQAGKPEAAQALKTAAAFWRKRVETIDQVLEPVLGKRSPKSGEQIVKALENMANPQTGNGARLRNLFAAMPKDEARSISATLISRMGQPTKGSANIAEEGGFSFNTFLTNYNNLSPRAKATIFPQESRDALDKLATVAKAVKEAGGAANTSNTGGALLAQGAISGFPAMFISPFAALGMGGSQYAVGRLLASPKFARLLAGAPKAATPAARRAFNARLTDLAKAEPAIQREIGMFQQAMNDNVAAPLAAEPTGQEQQ